MWSLLIVPRKISNPSDFLFWGRRSYPSKFRIEIEVLFTMFQDENQLTSSGFELIVANSFASNRLVIKALNNNWWLFCTNHTNEISICPWYFISPLIQRVPIGFH